MRRFSGSVLVLGLLLVLVAAPPATAQYKSWSGYVGGGGTFPTGDSGDSFKNGWNIGGGVAYNLTEKFSLQADYTYNRMGLNGEIFNVTDLDGSHSAQSMLLNALVFTNGSDNTSLYLLGGGGAVRRNVEITRFAGIGTGIICNPWWFVCFPVGVPVDEVLGSRSTWDAGVDVGLGFQFALGGGDAKFYVESRYTYIWGDEFQDPIREETVRGNTQYFTFAGGFRF